MDLKKVRQGWKNGRKLPYICKKRHNTCTCRVAFLCSFTSTLFLYLFKVHPYFKRSIAETFPLVSVLFWGVLNTISHCRQIRLSLAMRLHLNISCTYTQLPATFKQTLCWDDCYSQVLTSENRHFHALIHTSKYATSTSYIYAIVLFAGLNGLQVHQVHKDNGKWTSTYAQFLANSLQPVMHTFSSPGVARQYVFHPQLLSEKPKKWPNEKAKCLGDSVEAVAHQS